VPRTPSLGAEPPSAPPTPLPPPRADGRLPALARPLRYALALRVDPREGRFRGKVDVLVEVPQPTSHVVMHGRRLAVTAASFAPEGRPARLAKASARAAHGARAPEELVLDFGAPLPPGRGVLSLEYDAPFDDELLGLYRVKERESAYAFTQFEATYARRAFPCFDEPADKTPYDVSIEVPPGMIAVGNGAEARREPGAQGFTRFVFNTTPPIPSYLVAFAVGDLDVKAYPKSKLPLRVVTTKGKSGLGDLALEATFELVQRLEAYFGIAHPYEKLDVVAVPELSAGAMENPGLITFREELLLLDPKKTSVRARRAQAQVIAHELAHQWFGNLVTAAWWDDLWLNEGFATWMEDVAVDGWQPSFGAHLESVAQAQGVMSLDALASARAVRQPVTSTEEAAEAFDGITYDKGAAVLGMLEGWLGRPTFQRGVQSYLKGAAWKSAKADDLFAALESASGKPVARAARSFVDRPGVPQVRGKLTCEKGRYHIELSQSPWRPLGVRQTDAQRAWTMPVCVRLGGEKAPQCVDVHDGAPVLVAGLGCPSFYYPNAEQTGYYRVALDVPDWRRVLSHLGGLGVPERVGVLANLWAQVRAGELPAGFLLEALPAFDADDDRHVTEQVTHILGQMSDVVVEDAARAAFREFADKRLTPRRARLARAKETDDVVLARRAVDAALVDHAESAAPRTSAEAEVARWLGGAAVDADVLAPALELASRRADAARWDELKARLARAESPQDRVTMLRGLGAFDDRALVERTLDLALTDAVKVQDVRYLFGPLLGRRTTKAAAVAWTLAHWDDLRKKLPGALGSRMVWVVGSVCDADELDRVSKTVSARAKDMEGAARGFAEALEGAETCIALRQKSARELSTALQKGPKRGAK
jgi:aminopeptidase N